MFGILVLLFTVIPAFELVLLIKIGTHIGAINTLMIIILTGILGASLARFQGFLVIRKIQENLNKGIMPSAELIDGLMILVGGIVLLTPGFITDALGFLLLIPLTRSIIKALVKTKFEAMIREGTLVQTTGFSQTRYPDDDYNDIDVN